MSESLDKFLPPRKAVITERCANPNCRKILKATDVVYTLRIKGKEEPYCQDCVKKILRPQENSEENL